MMEEKIRELAYLKWERAGYPPGDGVNFWLEAEAELSDTPSKKSRTTPAKKAAKTLKGSRRDSTGRH